MDILNEFGFKPTLFIAQIVNFLILAYIFKRFLYKPLLKTIKDRQDKINKGLEDADNASKLIAKTEEDRENILKKTRIEAENIINDAKKVAEDEKERILIEAKNEADKIISQSKTQAGIEMEKIQKQVGNMSLELSRKILDNVLGSLFSDKEKSEINKRATAELKKIV